MDSDLDSLARADDLFASLAAKVLKLGAEFGTRAAEAHLAKEQRRTGVGIAGAGRVDSADYWIGAEAAYRYASTKLIELVNDALDHADD